MHEEIDNVERVEARPPVRRWKLVPLKLALTVAATAVGYCAGRETHASVKFLRDGMEGLTASLLPIVDKIQYLLGKFLH